MDSWDISHRHTPSVWGFPKVPISLIFCDNTIIQNNSDDTPVMDEKTVGDTLVTKIGDGGSSHMFPHVPTCSHMFPHVPISIISNVTSRAWDQIHWTIERSLKSPVVCYIPMISLWYPYDIPISPMISRLKKQVKPKGVPYRQPFGTYASGTSIHPVLLDKTGRFGHGLSMKPFQSRYGSLGRSGMFDHVNQWYVALALGNGIRCRRILFKCYMILKQSVVKRHKLN